jgi:hypothetical protein
MELTMGTWVLCSGGGFRGEVQVEPLLHLDHNRVIGGCGVSVGSDNILALKRPELLRVWKRINQKSDLMRLKNFNWKDGIYSLDPAMDLLQELGAFRDIQVPTFVGVVKATTAKYENIRVDTLHPGKVKAAVRCSNSIVPYPHEISRFENQIYTDGGEIHVLPRIPVEYLDKIDEVHAIFCSPIRIEQRVQRVEEDVNTIWKLIGAKLDDIVSRNIVNDVLYLESLRSMGKRVRIYAPHDFAQVGETFEIHPEIKRIRQQTSRIMLKTAFWLE